MAVLPGIVAALFENDTSPIRFEHFCLDICRELLGVELVPTSRTRDLARNGRGISTSGRELPVVLCATLEADTDRKVESDISRLAVTTRTKAVVYCSSKSLTEQKCAKVEARVREVCVEVESVQVLGQIQLADLAQRHEGILRRHYGAEIRNIEEALILTPGARPEPEDIGLRLALITQTGEDAWQLREQVARQLVLDTVFASGPLQPGEIARAITAQLHLPRAISANYVEGLVDQLRAKGLVSFEGGVVALTPVGSEEAQAIPVDAGARLLEGRVAVKEAIQTLTGYPLTDGQFDRVWNTLQDGLANLFYSRGMAMVRMVRSLLAEETPGADTRQPVKLFESLADRVAAVFSQPTQASEVRQAIVDMFAEKDSAAFRWLADICSVYVMMCSLGFEALSGPQTVKVLSSLRLVPDSDVVISLLCEGEDNHDEIQRILSGWAAMGGKLLMAKPVLEEVSYHAWISDNDYLAMEHEIARLTDAGARHLLENAFVRAFRKVAADLTARKYWYMYIQQYRGDSQWDYGRIMDLLRDDHGFGYLPDPGEDCAEFACRVEEFVAAKVSEGTGCDPEELDYRTRDKCRRDGLLLAAILAARRGVSMPGGRGGTCVLTSARLLSEAGQVFREDLGQPEAVLFPAALGLLVTLTPQVSMGLSALRSVLFDDLLVARLAPAQRYAYRLIAASERYDLPWSRRGTLLRELGHILLAEARSRGQSVKTLRERVLRTENPEYSALVVAKALDNMAIPLKDGEERSRLVGEIKRLKEEVEALLQTLRTRRQREERTTKDVGSLSRRSGRRRR